MFRLRTLFLIRPLRAGTVLALVALVGCQAGSPGVVTPQPMADVAAAGVSTAAPTDTTTDVAPQTTATDVVVAEAAPAVAPTPLLTPTPRPTPRPMPTPVPPGQALDPAATASKRSSALSAPR